MGNCPLVSIGRRPYKWGMSHPQIPAPFHRRTPRRAALTALVMALWPLASAAQGTAAQTAAPAATADPADTIVITGSTTGRRTADAPYAISVVSAEDLRASGPMVNLSESMARVPGLVVSNRNNYAQDLQISSRGFGARAGFGMRGVRAYTDGIPASMPDGQGQVSHFDLASAQRVEVLRGPFSVLYGNSSGGVIAMFSAPVQRTEVNAGVDVGSFGLRQVRAGVASPLGAGFDVRAGVSAFTWDGFRPQSEADKKTAHVRVGWQSDNDRVTVLLNRLDQPADDPLGLTRAQFEANPRQTTPQAAQFGTRKDLTQTQVGANWRHRFANMGPLTESSVTAYTGKRAVTQYLAILAATQANARHGGGVIDFDRSFSGLDARATLRFSDTLDAVVGVASERQADDRQGYLNYTGTQAAPTYGVIGALRRDERNKATSTDAYAQGEWRMSSEWQATAGLRKGRVKLSANDQFLSNGDDSGERSFGYTNPVVGLRFSPMQGFNMHVSVARGFESPTLGELAYRFDGTGGFNTALEPQRSKQVELGGKTLSADKSLAFEASVFKISVDNEIGVASNAGGRQSFRNVGRTLRQGLEFGAVVRFTPTLRAQAALTILDAKYRDAFLVCASIPCTTPNVAVAPGNRIAGTQKGLAYAELAWQAWASTHLAVEARAGSAVMANDANTDATPRYVLAALRATHRVPLAALGTGSALEILVRLDNVTNRKFVGSVIVNDANARYHEPGAPRAALISARLVKAF
jgi:iron complex outermembrane recepter protein